MWCEVSLKQFDRKILHNNIISSLFLAMTNNQPKSDKSDTYWTKSTVR